EEERDIIFEKFRQAKAPGQSDDVLTREHQGTGLGLSIVRELTKLLGGDVHLESQPGKGRTFTIRGPLMLSGNRKFEVNLSDERVRPPQRRRAAPGPRPPPPLMDAPPPPPPPRRSGRPAPMAATQPHEDLNHRRSSQPGESHVHRRIPVISRAERATTMMK